MITHLGQAGLEKQLGQRRAVPYFGVGGDEDNKVSLLTPTTSRGAWDDYWGAERGETETIARA